MSAPFSLTATPPVPRSNARRGALKAAGTGALLGMPAIVTAQTEITLKFQSTWPTKDIFHEFALDLAKKVTELSARRLRIDILPANAVVRAFGLLEAVHKGQLDGGHGVPTYWHDRHPAFSLFGSGPATGMDGNTFLAWFEYGGGKALYDQLLSDVLKLNVTGWLYGPMGAQPLGWFKKPVTKAVELQGLKFRSVGLAREVFAEMGVNVTAMPASEIMAALDRGLIDAAEFNNPSSDRALGLSNVVKSCMLQSLHQNSEVFEILINRRRFEGLPGELQSVFHHAVQAASADLTWKSIDRYATDYEAMERQQSVRFRKTPTEIMQAQMQAWKRVIERRSQSNEFFGRVVESQMVFARRVVGWQLDSTPPMQIPYEFWFGKRRIDDR